MLSISEKTAAAFASQSNARFHQQVARTLGELFPEYAQDREALAATVDLAVIDGQEMGIKSARGLAMFALLMLLIGVDVKHEPGLRRALLSSGLNEAGKIKAMESWIMTLAEGLE